MFFTADGFVRFPELGVEIEHLADGIEVFGIHISYYGILIACAMLFGLIITEYLAKKSGQNPELYLDFAITAIVAGILGARAVYVIQRWSYFKTAPGEIFSLSSGGLSFFGALLAAFFAAYLFCKRKKYDLWKLCDTAIIGVLFGQIIGRWGDFFNRDLLGTYSDGILAMQIEARDVDAEMLMLSRASLTGMDGVLQVHPVFLYEIIWNVVLFILLLVVNCRKKFSGQIFSIYLFGYGMIRFLTEFIRVDAARTRMPRTWFTWGHIASAAVMIAGIVLFVLHYLKYRKGVCSREKKH
ncbi:MAG: prolipoprotein diacylglyceryl transferase [Lachnospiraceae bacterium]